MFNIWNVNVILHEVKPSSNIQNHLCSPYEDNFLKIKGNAVSVGEKSTFYLLLSKIKARNA